MDPFEGSDPHERRMERGTFNGVKNRDAVSHHTQYLTKSVKREVGQRRVFDDVDRNLKHGTPKQLVANGHWNVPIAERPKGWESRGIPE